MTWSPEIALLLDATSPYGREGCFAHSPASRRGLDWSELLRLAIPHGVLPLLSHNLSVHRGECGPARSPLLNYSFWQECRRGEIESNPLNSSSLFLALLPGKSV